MIIDFREIPDGNIWELFCRDFLSELGIEIKDEPAIGPDGGKDLIANDKLQGIFFRNNFRILISCKHFAHRSKSNNVNRRDENNIIDRVQGHECDCFIGFYSTGYSQSLYDELKRIKKAGKIKEILMFDYKKIESILLRDKKHELMKRYFPASYKYLYELKYEILDEYVPLRCDGCGKDILFEISTRKFSANIIRILNKNLSQDKELIVDIFWTCEGECGNKVIQQLIKINPNIQVQVNENENIDKLTNPLSYIEFNNRLFEQTKLNYPELTDRAREKVKKLLTILSQTVMRKMSKTEKINYDEVLGLGGYNEMD